MCVCVCVRVCVCVCARARARVRLKRWGWEEECYQTKVGSTAPSADTGLWWRKVQSLLQEPSKESWGASAQKYPDSLLGFREVCLFVYWLCWPFTAVGAFFQLQWVGAALCCGSQALVHRLSSCGTHPGVVAAWQVGSSRSSNWTRVLCIGRRILYHWATREALGRHFLRPGGERGPQNIWSTPAQLSDWLMVT